MGKSCFGCRSSYVDNSAGNRLVCTIYDYYNDRICTAKRITLPDNSLVTLNANSSISYHRAWAWQNIREVWVSGEVYLNVTHLNTDPTHIKTRKSFACMQEKYWWMS
jgi:hypothetical protein